MAIKTWIGTAAQVSQVWQAALTAVTSTDTYIITATDETGATSGVTYTAGGGDTTLTVAAGLTALINGSSAGQFRGVLTASPTTTATITVTAVQAGVPFYLATSGTGSFASSGNTVANSGPNDWNCPANWAGNTVPVSTDSVNLSGASAIRYGLNQSAVTLAALQRNSGASMSIGSPGKYFQIACTSFMDNGAGLAYINLGASAIAPVINNGSGSSTTPGLYLRGSALTTLTCAGGNTALAVLAGETSTVATISTESGASVQVGSGVTLTDFVQAGGTSFMDCAATTVIVSGGSLTTAGSGAIATFTINGTGTQVFPNSTGTVTTMNCLGGSTSFLQSDSPRTVTTLNYQPPAGIAYDTSYLTLTNGITPAGRATVSSQNS